MQESRGEKTVNDKCRQCYFWIEGHGCCHAVEREALAREIMQRCESFTHMQSKNPAPSLAGDR
jgi:hypothetical protein